MKVTLDSGSAQFVRQQVASGAWRSAAEMIQEGLFLLRHREELQQLRLKRLREDIALAEEQLRRGQYQVYDEDSLDDLVKSIERRGRERLAREKPAGRQRKTVATSGATSRNGSRRTKAG